MWRPLTQPYPIDDSVTKKWFTIFFMGVFIYLFLYIFRPFGLMTLPFDSANKILAGYGLICSAVLVIDLILIPDMFPGVFTESKWNVGKHVLFTLWNIFTIGLANAFYTSRVWKMELTWAKIFQFQVITLVVAILPVTILVMIRQIAMLRKNLNDAQSLTESMNHKKRLNSSNPQFITLKAENAKDDFRIYAHDLLFITSADNYIEVHFMENNVAKKKLIRATLRGARENLRHLTAFYRCHRAWIVNLDRVESITGNSQGYRLVVEHTDVRIPVSRNLNKELSQRIAK